MSWIFIADDGEEVHYAVPPRVAELEQKLSEIKDAFNEADMMRSRHLCKLAELREAAQYAADVISLDPPGRFYHSPQDWEAMEALKVALKLEGE